MSENKQNEVIHEQESKDHYFWINYDKKEHPNYLTFNQCDSYKGKTTDGGNLFFEQGAISSVQLNIIKDQMWHSDKFRHIDDKDFSAYDMYNHITESLKRSHPLCYIQNHVTVHKLFEDTFLKQNEPMIIDTPVLEEV